MNAGSGGTTISPRMRWAMSSMELSLSESANAKLRGEWSAIRVSIASANVFICPDISSPPPCGDEWMGWCQPLSTSTHQVTAVTISPHRIMKIGVRNQEYLQSDNIALHVKLL